jgi:hypothetical protein
MAVPLASSRSMRDRQAGDLKRTWRRPPDGSTQREYWELLPGHGAGMTELRTERDQLVSDRDVID